MKCSKTFEEFVNESQKLKLDENRNKMSRKAIDTEVDKIMNGFNKLEDLIKKHYGFGSYSDAINDIKNETIRELNRFLDSLS